MALTEHERQILRLHAEGLSDYPIAHKLNMEMPNVKRPRKNALKKLERAKADLEFVGQLKSLHFNKILRSPQPSIEERLISGLGPLESFICYRFTIPPEGIFRASNSA